MESIIAASKVLLSIHVMAGFISLVCFWIPVFAKKGGNLHVKSGKVYVWMMWIVTISAILLSFKNAYIGQYYQAVFLGFLALITSHALWHAIAILKMKKGFTKGFLKMKLYFSGLIVFYGLGLIITGILIWGNGPYIIMIFFGLVGFLFFPDFKNTLQKKPKPVSWFKEHFSGMIISGTAAYTAFLVFGAYEYVSQLSQFWQALPWILPTIITVVGMKFYEKRYEQQSERSMVNEMI